MSYILQQIKLGELNTNCYIFGDTNTNEVCIIDPADNGERLLQIINDNNYNVRYIILTHGHYDHIGAVKFLKEFTCAKVLIHQLDGNMLISSQKNLSEFAASNSILAVKADKYIKEDDIIKIGEKELRIIHTPGHTSGGICILSEDVLFSGDTLFKGTIGRTDLPSSNHNSIIESLKRLMKLDDDINVYPGHGDSTTIGCERINNTFAL